MRRTSSARSSPIWRAANRSCDNSAILCELGMMVRKFSRDELGSEPHDVLFKDLYPWDAIDRTPFGSSLALVQPGGRTMLHSHDPAETFIICRGTGTISVNDQ